MKDIEVLMRGEPLTRARPTVRIKTREQIEAERDEKLAEGNDWRNGANRLRELLEEWKALPRLDKSADDALWRRFSTATPTTSSSRARRETAYRFQGLERVSTATRGRSPSGRSAEAA